MSFGRLLFGAILVGIGGALLASHLGYLPAGVMPWFLQFWPVLLILIGLALLANAMKNALLGWLVALIAIGAIAFGAWWLANHKNAAGTIHETTHSLTKPLVQTLTIRARTFGGRLTLASTTSGAIPADAGSRALAASFQVSVQGVSEKDADHIWNVGGRSAEFIWPKGSLIPGTAPFGATVTLRAPDRTAIRSRTQTILSGMELDLTRLRPEVCDLSVISGGAKVLVGSSPPQAIRVRGTLGAVEIDLPPSGPVRLEFLSPLTARSLPEDFVENVGGRGKAKIWISEGKGTPLLIQIDGVLLYAKIKRAPQRAGG